MSSSGSTAFGLVTWDPYSGRAGNAHTALYGCKQDMAMQHITLLSFSMPITSMPSFWVAMCGLQTEELCLLNFCRMIGKGESHADRRLLQLVQPFDGKFKKESLSHLGPAGHKERHFHTTAGGVTAAWAKAAEIWN